MIACNGVLIPVLFFLINSISTDRYVELTKIVVQELFFNPVIVSILHSLQSLRANVVDTWW